MKNLISFLFLISFTFLVLHGCSGNPDTISSDSEGFNTIEPSRNNVNTDTASEGNCRTKEYNPPCNETDNTTGGTSTAFVSPWTLNLTSGKFCSFSGATSNASYFTQSSGPGTSDTRTYALGSNSYGEINNTPSTDPMGITLMDMREPTTQLAGGDSGLFALQNKTQTESEFGTLTVNHKPAINVQIFGSGLGEGEYLLKSHQTSFDSKYGKSAWKVEAGHRATYILTNTGYLISSGDNSWSQQVSEYSYDDVNGKFVFAQDIGGDENYPNQGNNSDRHFKNVLDVSALSYGVCMIHGQRNVGGAIWCRGKSNHGQALYDGSSSTANQYKEAIKTMTPAELEALPEVNWHKYKDHKDFVLIAGGYNHVCGLRTNAEIYCFGSNEKGQTGQPLETTSVFTPSRVMLDNGTPLYGKFIYNSRNSTYVISPEGQLWSFGSNESSKLGVGSTIGLNDMTHVPQRVGGDTSDWSDVASYNHHVVGIRGEGKNRRYFAWGSNSHKQISLSDDSHFSEPVEIFLPQNENF